MEKTVVDIVFYREKVGIEETKEILVTYLQRKDRNLNRLLKYAELMKIHFKWSKCGLNLKPYPSQTQYSYGFGAKVPYIAVADE